MNQMGDGRKCVALHNIDMNRPGEQMINGDYPSTPDAFVTRLQQIVRRYAKATDLGGYKAMVSKDSEGQYFTIVKLQDWSDPLSSEIGSAVVVFPMIFGLDRCRSLMGGD
jgi:hypothetical protein